LIRARITQQGVLADVRTFSTEGRICTHMSDGPEGLLLGTQENGLFRAEVHATGLRMQQVFGSNDPHRIEELPFQNIHHVYVDRDGSVWLSSRQGLGLLQSRFFSGVAGMTQNNTLSVHPDGERVLLSFGDVVEVQPGMRRDFTVRILPSSDESFVTSLAAAADRLWMGTANGRLRASTKGRIVRTFDLTDRGGGIFYMYSDRRGSVWLCQAPADTPLKGVTKIEPNGEMRFYDADDGVENRILVLKEGPRGTLYAAGIGPETYLFRYQPDRDRFINLSLPLPFSYSQNFEVHDLAVDTRGIVWLATTDGLLRYDLERVHRVDLGEFTATEIRSLEAMPDGSIWMATDTQGLLHYRTGTVVQFAESTGLPTKVSVYRTLRKDGQGRIWVGTAEGAVHSRDRRPTPEPTPTPVVLSAAVNGRSVSNADPIVVGRRDVLSLRYATLTFPATHLRYQYRLRGGPDTSWSDPVARNRLQLNRLPLGDHTLEIRAREGDGHYWSAALRIPIEVHPVWYRTWWAYLVYVLGGSAVLAYGVHRSVMRQRRRIHELEDALAEREEAIEAKDRKLQRQHQDLEEVEAALSSQEQEARTARTTLNVLHDLIQDLPTNASWSEVVHTLAGAVEEIDGIDAFEFGYFDEGSICYEGYDQRRHTYTHRREDFDEKTVVPVWSLVHDEPVRIGDYRREHTQYVHPNQAYRYQSMLCLPFHLPGRQHLVFVVYGVPKHTFDEQDLMMAQVLVDYLGVALKRPLQPTARD
jgi:streptogramin lyase